MRRRADPRSTAAMTFHERHDPAGDTSSESVRAFLAAAVPPRNPGRCPESPRPWRRSGPLTPTSGRTCCPPSARQGRPGHQRDGRPQPRRSLLRGRHRSAAGRRPGHGPRGPGQDRCHRPRTQRGIRGSPDGRGSSGQEDSEETTSTKDATEDASNTPETDEDATDTPETDEASAGKGSEISELAKNTESTGVDKGAEISTQASGGNSQAGQHGAPADTPTGPPVGAGKPTDVGKPTEQAPSAH